MIFLLRLFLIGLIFYLLFRSFYQYTDSGKEPSREQQKENSDKRISKDTGEYIDYEETNK
jgi:hypothetical protein